MSHDGPPLIRRSSDIKCSFRPLLNVDKLRRLIHSFLDTRQICIISRVSKWWCVYLSGPTQDSTIWNEVNLSICAPHAATDTVLVTLFKSHPKIQHLDLKFCGKISDKAIEEAAHLLKDLQRLEVEGCGRRLSDEGLKHLRLSVNLTTLNLNGCQRMTPTVIESILKECKSIHTLAIGGMVALEDKSLISILRAGPKIQCLYLNSCSKLTNLAVEAAAKILKTNLKELEVAYCANIDDDAIIHLAQHAPNLTSLNLYGCSQITDRSLEALSTLPVSGSLLKKLNLSMCRNITDLGLRHLLEGKKNCSLTLESLNLYDCTKISNTGIILIGKKCPRLKFLEVFGLDGLDINGLETFLAQATRLEKLDCGGCQKITSASLETLMKRYHHLFT